MASFIFKEILYGELRPWLITDLVSAKEEILSYGRYSDESDSPYESLSRLLHDKPKLLRQLDECREYADAQPDTGAPFTRVNYDQPFNRSTSYYKSLLDHTAELVLLQTLSGLKNNPGQTDRIYRLNSATRTLLDLLIATGKIKTRNTDSTSRYVLQYQEDLLITLLVDLGLRLPALPEVERYLAADLYLMALNQPVADPIPFRYTAAYHQTRLQQMVREAAPDDEIARLRKEIAGELEENSTHHSPIIRHLENVLFLRRLDHSLYAIDPDKLTDDSYCRERMAELRSTIIREDDPDKKTRLLQTVADTAHHLNQLIPERLPIAPQSEAAGICEMIHHLESGSHTVQTRESSVTHPVADETSSGHNSSVDEHYLLREFQENYISFDNLATVWKMDARALKRFLQNNNIQTLQITTHNQWIQRADVEQFLSKQKQNLNNPSET